MTDSMPEPIGPDPTEESVKGKQYESEEVGEIQSDLVQVKQSSVSQINSEKVTLEQSAAVAISAQEVSASNSAVVFVETSRIELESNNFLLLSNAGEAHIQQSQVGTLFSSSAHLDQSTSGITVAREIHAGTIQTGILLAGQVDGPVETYLDTPRALLVGVVSGVAMGLVFWLGNFLSRRRG